MLTRLRSLEQLMPFATAGELLAKNGRPAIAISSGATVVGALHVMQREDVGFLPVLDEGKLAGVLSERDIARGAMLEQRVFVRDIMTTRIHTVTPETKVSECAGAHAHATASGIFRWCAAAACSACSRSAT